MKRVNWKRVLFAIGGAVLGVFAAPAMFMFSPLLWGLLAWFSYEENDCPVKIIDGKEGAKQ